VSQIRICREKVIFEEIGAETVVIDLDSGYYFSLLGSAGAILNLLDEGCRLEDLVPSLGHRCGQDLEPHAAEIRHFVSELVVETLCQEVPDGTIASPTRPAEATRPYSRPEIQKYTEMHELFLLDPVKKEWMLPAEEEAP
jgi:hypothetical protein